MNIYLDGAGLGQLIVTCRSSPYEALVAEERWAQDAARIALRPVTAEVAWAFLEARTGGAGRWMPVMEAIAQHPLGPLARALSTPWYLTVAATVYQPPHSGGLPDRYPTELLAPTLNSERAVRDHLLSLLIPAATASVADPEAPGRQRPAPYSTDQVRAWLGVLAGYLHSNIATGRSVGGQRLPGTDLVLHELWPLAGLRLPIFLHRFLSALVLLTGTFGAAALATALHWELGLDAEQLAEAEKNWNPASASDRVLFLAARSLFVGGMLWMFWGLSWITWPIDIPSLRQPYWPWNLMPLAFIAGLVFGFLIALTNGQVVLSAAVYAIVWAFIGLLITLAARAVPWLRLAAAFAGIFAFVLCLDLADGSLQATLFTLGVVFGLILAFWVGAASMRYVAFLLATRRLWASDRWLPWRLARFLDWCCEVGVMRSVGVAYQFRHRELQEFLARTAAAPVSNAASSSSECGDGR
ncbi:hypothetical protein [Streptomyces chumphonensis]|uniref:hypothetical protein n=1 Tax=Streptomyces chumphonensis TaxID=1214925 RepID=UPI003D7356FD